MTESPRELVREAELSRARLDLAIDQLETRLTPRGLADEAIGLARRGVARPVVRDALRLVGQHPLPIFMIAAGAGLLAWRLMEQSGTGEARREIPDSRSAGALEHD